MGIIRKESSRIQNISEADAVLRKKKTLTWTELGDLLDIAVEEETTSSQGGQGYGQSSLPV